MFVNTVDPDNPLTPSEVVFLNYGEQFSKKVAIEKSDFMHIYESAPPDPPIGTILATAILACEEVGAFHLEIREREQVTILRIRKVRELFAAPANTREYLPEYSLEATFADLATYLASQNKNNIYTILYTWLQEDYRDPWKYALDLFKAGMAKRGLLEATEEWKLDIFKVTRYTLPERTARLAKGQSIGPVEALLDNCQRTRPEVWIALEASIKNAIAARTIVADDWKI